MRALLAFVTAEGAIEVLNDAEAARLLCALRSTEAARWPDQLEVLTHRVALVVADATMKATATVAVQQLLAAIAAG